MKIIAVTSCPVGLAHTYMASGAIKKYGKKHGHEVLVETQGSMGIRDRLSEKDIAEADIFIDCADVAMMEPERFKHVKTFKTTTSLVIKKTNQVLDEALESIMK